MPEPKTVMCAKCAGEIVPGTFFCFRHASEPPKIGEATADCDQLRWSTTGEATGATERLLAVLLDGAQVAVKRVDEATSARPARLHLDLADPQSPSAATTAAYVDLSALLDAVLRGDEVIEATRHA